MNVNTPMYFFFFKQKTAYELRISDWSSDVCSSDLVGKDVGELAGLDRSYGVVVRDAAEQEQSIVPADIMLNTIGDLLDRNYPVYERFLSAGINVLCHGTQSYNPFFENRGIRSEEHTSELQSLMRISYAVFCLKKNTTSVHVMSCH